MIDLPYPVHKTRQVEGMVSEKKAAKKRGAKLHPRSGAGTIKWDASTDDELIEYKDAAKTITVNGKYLEKLFRDASAQGKDAIFVVTFGEANIILEGRITRSTN